MSSNGNGLFEPLVVVFILFIFTLFCLIVRIGNSEFHGNIIKHRAAEWQIDSVTGKKRFVWADEITSNSLIGARP
jgi:hypothetical protein